jgi:hypothetical protein
MPVAKKVAKKWADLEGHDFTKHPLGLPIEEAVAALRKMPAKEAEFTAGYHFFAEAEEIFVAALWLEVKNALERAEAPKLPKDVKVLTEYGESEDYWCALTLDYNSLDKGYAWATEHKETELETMFRVLAKCAHDRLFVTTSTVLLEPEDWWIRLIAADKRLDLVEGILDPHEGEIVEAE